MSFDSRVTPARTDLAAAFLKGAVTAQRYMDGTKLTAGIPVLDVRPRPDLSASLDTQLLYGERFTAYEIKDGWAWGQAADDAYVGYVRAEGLGPCKAEPTHRVAALSAPIRARPDVKAPVLGLLPLNACLTAEDEEGNYIRFAIGQYVYARQLVAHDQHKDDWVAICERHLGAPYVWGGRSPMGLDCSGLIQAGHRAAGLECPRDTDMQEKALGDALNELESQKLRRGDLVFWRGHVGVMIDGVRLLHANAFHMSVTAEPLAEVKERIERSGTPISSIRRTNGSTA